MGRARPRPEGGAGVNPLGLRYEIFKALAGLSRPASIVSVDLPRPVPGTPLTIDVNTVDPSGKPRVYVVTITEQ